MIDIVIFVRNRQLQFTSLNPTLITSRIVTETTHPFTLLALFHQWLKKTGTCQSKGYQYKYLIIFFRINTIMW